MKWTIFLGVAASLGGLLLCCVFLFWNPYSETTVSGSTIGIMLVMLICPAILGVLGSVTRNGTLMHVVFFWSLPFGVYLSVASIPSIWNLFILMLIIYLMSAIQMRKVRELS